MGFNIISTLYLKVYSTINFYFFYIYISPDDIISFQNGVDIIYNGCITYGSTPSSKTPNDIVTSIGEIYNNGFADGTAASGQKYYLEVTCSISLASKTSNTKNSQSVTLYINDVEINKSSTTSTWGTTSRITMDLGPGSDYPLIIGDTYTIRAYGRSSGHDSNVTASNTTKIYINGREVGKATGSGGWGNSSATATYDLIPE